MERSTLQQHRLHSDAAKRVDAARTDLEKMAGEHPELKALAEGLSTGGAFLGGGLATFGSGHADQRGYRHRNCPDRMGNSPGRGSDRVPWRWHARRGGRRENWRGSYPNIPMP